MPAKHLEFVLLDEPGGYLLDVDHASPLLEHPGDEQEVIVLLVQPSGGEFAGPGEDGLAGDIAHVEEGVEEGLVVDVLDLHDGWVGPHNPQLQLGLFPAQQLLDLHLLRTPPLQTLALDSGVQPINHRVVHVGRMLLLDEGQFADPVLSLLVVWLAVSQSEYPFLVGVGLRLLLGLHEEAVGLII